MKKFILLLILSSFLFSCSTDEKDIKTLFTEEWIVTNVRNNSNEILCEFSSDEYLWEFEENIVYIESFFTASLCNLYTNKSYQYTLFEYEENNFLLLDSKEIGKVEIVENETTYSLTIDGTILTNNLNVDGKIITLTRNK